MSDLLYGGRLVVWGQWLLGEGEAEADAVVGI